MLKANELQYTSAYWTSRAKLIVFLFDKDAVMTELDTTNIDNLDERMAGLFKNQSSIQNIIKKFIANQHFVQDSLDKKVIGSIHDGFS